LQPSSAFIPLFIARENGWIEEALKEKGVTVLWNDFESGPPMNESLAAGSSDIGTLGDVPTVSGLAAGQDNVIFAAACEAPDSYQMLARKDSGINGPADLKNKKVGTVVGSTGHVLTEKLLKTVGMDLSDVEIVNISMGDAQTVLENKEVDAIAGWEPNNTRLIATGTVKSIGKGSECGLMGANTLVARRTFAEGNPEIIQIIIEQYARGVNAMDDLDKETINAVSKALSIDPELFYSVASSYDYTITISDEFDAALQETIAFLVKIDVIDEEYDVSEYINTEYISMANI
jgi:sulfonate transport system substrate-binding protein